MAAQNLPALRLTRNQLAMITKNDVDATKQFERLFAATWELMQAGGFVARGTLAEVDATVLLVGSPVGCRTTITDSVATTAAGIGLVVAGGGVEVVPAYFDGADWRIG
jgi:hypothetical protein